MIRQFSGSRPAFVLETRNTSYAIRILPTGHPEQLYYGPRLPLSKLRDLRALTQKNVFVPSTSLIYDEEHPQYTLEDLCLECSAPGKGDLREPLAELVHADGSRRADHRGDQ